MIHPIYGRPPPAALGACRCPIQLLNARPEAVRREAKIIAQAGEPGAVSRHAGG